MAESQALAICTRNYGLTILRALPDARKPSYPPHCTFTKQVLAKSGIGEAEKISEFQIMMNGKSFNANEVPSHFLRKRRST